ncbi:MAG: FtsW/RodA/SpoVE family cell cycle protein [Aquificaceae bacterium]
MQGRDNGLIIIYAVIGLFLISQTMVVSVNLVPYFIENPLELKIYRKSILHAIVFGFGLFVALRISKFDYRRFLNPKVVYFMVFTSLLSLIIVLIKKLASGKNVERWLFGTSVQPLEFVKISLLIFMAYYISSKGSLRSFAHFIWAFFIVLCHAVLLFFQPDKGGAVFITLLSSAMAYVGGISKKPLLIAGVFSFFIIQQLINMEGYVGRRISAWKDPFADVYDSGYQIVQSIYALSKGGLFGVGIGQGLQKAGALPTADTDYILATIGEEMGFIGILLVSFLYSMLVGGLFYYSFKVKEVAGRLLLFGIGLNFMLAFFWNSVMVSNLSPPKGIALPFLSYGSSNLFASMLMVGIALSVIRSSSLATRSGSIAFKHW